MEYNLRYKERQTVYIFLYSKSIYFIWASGIGMDYVNMDERECGWVKKKHDDCGFHKNIVAYARWSSK